MEYMFNILGERIGDIIIILIIISAIIGIVLAIKKEDDRSNFCGSIAMTLGVLGTFLGVALGLRKFDTVNIIESVPILLDGLKVAFTTSIWGMSTSIGLRIINELIQSFGKKKEDETTILFQSLLKGIENLSYTLKENQKRNDNMIIKLGKVFEDNQIELKNKLIELNSDLNSKQSILVHEFRNFGKSMAQNNTNALIQALQNVVVTFNNNMIDEFGANFKEFNKAVGKIIVWQEEYKETIRINTNQFKKVTESVADIDKGLKEIYISANGLSNMGSNINNILKEVNLSKNEIKEGVKGILDMSSNLKQSTPIFEGYIEKINSNYNSSINNLDRYAKEIQNLLSLSNQQIVAQNNLLRELAGDFRKSIQMEIEDINDATSKEIIKSVNVTEQVFMKRVEQMNNMLEYELKESLNSLGTQLATLSEKFVDDYTPLTKKLKAVISIAEKV